MHRNQNMMDYLLVHEAHENIPYGVTQHDVGDPSAYERLVVGIQAALAAQRVGRSLVGEAPEHVCVSFGRQQPSTNIGVCAFRDNALMRVKVLLLSPSKCNRFTP